jgi:glycosyltransferase involved in cell wall biosynthesis
MLEGLPVPNRILITADTMGGVWTYALELVKGLTEQGVQVALATMGNPLTPQQQAAVSQLSNLEVFESCFKLEWMKDPWEEVHCAGEWLLGIEQHFRPDIVHLNGYVHATLPWSSPILVVGHSCVLSWWQAVKGEAAPADWQRYHQEVAQGLRAADLVIAPSRTMLAALQQHYGPLADGRVILNGRDPQLFPASVKQAFILTAGRLWDEAKNVAALTAIAPKLQWPVYVAGEPKHPERRAATISSISPSEISSTPFKKRNPSQISPVYPLGHLSTPEMALWLAEAAIYALPARYEPFGLSVLEAALSGCALVLGDIPSLREIWQDAAVFVSPEALEPLAGELNALIADPDRRDQLAIKARTQALKLTSHRMTASYLSAYRDLMSHGRGGDRASSKQAVCPASVSLST